jgi:dihydrofolate synthase/folylpolyglutamate synthase
VVGKDLFFEALDSNLEWQNFRLLSRYREYPYLRIKLLGDFQLENAAAAVAAAEELSYKGIFISSDAIKDGLAKARWPGRLEIMNKKPFIVVDGAQDVNSVSRLRKAVRDILKYKRLFLIFGAMQDKDIDGMCRILSGMADCVVTTKSKSERAASSRLIREKMLKCNKDIDIIVTDSVAEAVRKCKGKACEEDLILATGSLYVVAEVMEELAQMRGK